MDEKLESEIFEEQLNSLYKPIKQEEKTPSAPESENKNNQSLANQSLANSQANANQSLEANEPSYLSTGIAYLDNKIKNRNITAFDYYMAKKFLGLDLNVNLNGNLNIKSENKTRLASINKATQDIFDDIKALDLGDDLIKKAQDNSGIFSALKRLANEKTSGLYGLNSDEAETVNALKNYSYSTARQMGGQLTNQKIKDAQEMTKFGFRSKEENTARLGENQSRLIQILEQDINNLESLGGKVPESVILELVKHKKRLEHIQKNQGKIKLKEYQQITPYSKQK
ncbi:Coiled-coil domain-containing protein [Helicobacter pylori]|uniref:Coiled-coil domain-containing protein n=1 Tax=Helicobacter pylori TaxID=210 RepID=UPI001E309241|nr:Coiled-coil domain-containing protein [Helicobacter pylori]